MYHANSVQLSMLHMISSFDLFKYEKKKTELVEFCLKNNKFRPIPINSEYHFSNAIESSNSYRQSDQNSLEKSGGQ